MLVTLTVFIILVAFIYNHFTKYNNYWKERNVAGPEPTFFFGNIKDMVLGKRSVRDIYKEIYDSYPDEKIVGVFRMRSPNLLVKDLDIIKHIMIKDFYNFTDRDIDVVEEGLGANLFNANDSTWRTLRNHMNPIFTSGKLKNMVHLIVERGDKLVEYVDRIISTQPEQEVYDITGRFTQSCIAAWAFGLDIDTFNGPNDFLKKLEKKIFFRGYKHELEYMYPGILKRMGVSFIENEVIDFFRGLTKDIIALRDGEPTDRTDFVNVMLALRKAERISAPEKEKYEADNAIVDISDDVIAGQMYAFYAAGYQSTATTMGFMLYQLAVNPDIQDRVVEEIDKVLQNHEGQLTYQAVFDMKYLGQVFDETLRLHPSGDTVRRRARADYKVPGTNLTVKKGQIILVPISAIHMDPRNYPDPEIFDPERFSPEKVAARHPCANLSFGVGPRHCIGVRFAQIMSKVGMAKLLSSFRVEPSGQTPVRMQQSARIFAYPKGGFPLKLVKRC